MIDQCYSGYQNIWIGLYVTNLEAEETWMFTDGTTYISHTDDNLDGIGNRCGRLNPMDSYIDVTGCPDVHPYACYVPGEAYLF